jgi:hypothetical protein
LSKQNNGPVIAEGSKKSIKMTIKLDQGSEQVMTGLRIRIDQNSKSANGIQFKLFNRTPMKFKAGQAIFFDIPFCDSEIIYAASQGIESEFITEDLKNAPIKILQIELYGVNKKDFGLKDKVKRI